MKYLHLSALLLMVLSYVSSKAQSKIVLPTGDIKSATRDEYIFNAPKGITRTVKQDSKGNIWMAAFDGVFRYDGKSFTNITSEVSSARFFAVLEDRKGNFWFSTVGSGVFYYDGKSFQHFTTKEGLANDQVIDIYEDKTGNIWFGTLSGVSRYDGKSFQNYWMHEEEHRNDHNDVNSIIEDKTGKFWFGTRGNACVYDGKSFTILTHNGRPFKNIRTIIEDKKGNIWLGGNGGLWRYDGSTFTNYTTDFVGYIHEDKNGNIWTSSQIPHVPRWALTRYDEKSMADKKPTVIETKIEFAGTTEMFFGILAANDGSIWFGALDGVHRYDGNTITGFKAKAVQE